MSDLVSIVVPMYNAEKTIRRCIGSLVAQSYTEIEIIMVDDGSTDGTIDIIKKYMENNEKIKLIEFAHVGSNFARREGVKNATGKYLMFVDADDYIKKDAVSILVEAFKRSRVDVIKYNAEYYPNGGIVLPVQKYIKNKKIINNSDVMSLLLTTYTLNNLWSQIYTMDAVKRAAVFRYDLVFAEDFLANLEIHKKTNRMLIMDNVLYYYCDNTGSTTRDDKRVVKNIQNRIFASEKAMEYIDKNIKDAKLRDKAFSAQLEAIKNSFVSLCRLDGYSKAQLAEDFTDNRLNLFEFKSRKKIINAILKLDYDYMWRYICWHKILRKILRRGK